MRHSAVHGRGDPRYTPFAAPFGRRFIAFNPLDPRDLRPMSNFIGKAAPAFSADAVMPDGSTKSVSLSDYSGQYVALFFYPKDFTFV